MTDVATVESNETAGTETKMQESTIENAYGRPLSALKFKEGKTPVTVISYAFSYEHVTNFDAIPAKEMPDKDEILAVVNAARKANERQKAMQKALDAAGVIKPTMEDDDTLKIKSIVAGLVASKKYNEEQATALAKQMLGLS
jgi:Cu2+-containing amine oxidase